MGKDLEIRFAPLTTRLPTPPPLPRFFFLLLSKQRHRPPTSRAPPVDVTPGSTSDIQPSLENDRGAWEPVRKQRQDRGVGSLHGCYDAGMYVCPHTTMPPPPPRSLWHFLSSLFSLSLTASLRVPRSGRRLRKKDRARSMHVPPAGLGGGRSGGREAGRGGGVVCAVFLARIAVAVALVQMQTTPHLPSSSSYTPNP